MEICIMYFLVFIFKILSLKGNVLILEVRLFSLITSKLSISHHNRRSQHLRKLLCLFFYTEKPNYVTK